MRVDRDESPDWYRMPDHGCRYEDSCYFDFYESLYDHDVNTALLSDVRREGKSEPPSNIIRKLFR